MQRRSPPKHRHDGTSPLPLGMDWSPAPRKFNGRDTVWPHDPRSGWSYCVSIPSWVALPKSRDSDPVVFYRVEVGIQSPEGTMTTRRILRRFNDFLKLFANTKKQFPKKTIPPAPPKGFLRMKTRALLEERKCALEEWMTKLLSDIDISRSVAVASFLELEAAARSSFRDESQHASETNTASNSEVTSLRSPLHSGLSVIAGSSSITSDYGSDTAYEASDLGTPSVGTDDNFDIAVEDLALDEDLTSPIEKLVKYGMSNIGEGLFLGETILGQLEGLPRNKVHDRYINNIMNDACNGNTSKASFLSHNGLQLFSELENGKTGHAQKLSNESVDSNYSSLRGSEKSIPWIPNSSGKGSFDLHGSGGDPNATEILGSTELQLSGDTQIVVPLDQRHKMNRSLSTMQQRLVTARTDMEDLIARFNQEIAVKDYLATKVNDLEVELENTKQKSKENIQQAISVEMEKVTQMQWDMEELRRKSMEMELKLKPQEVEKAREESTTTLHEKDALQQELDTAKGLIENLQKQYEELEAKSKADIKVLVKEVKSLRSSQAELKQEVRQTLKEKSEAENSLEQEKEMRHRANNARKNLLHECRNLHRQLQEHTINFISEDGNMFILDPSSSLEDAVNLLTKFDDQINLLLDEAQSLSKDDQTDSSQDDPREIDAELRKVLLDIFSDNARLMKQVRSVFVQATKMTIEPKKVDEEGS